MMNENLLIDRLIELAGQSEIAHHIPGRIRLKVKLSALFLARDLEISDLVDCFRGILDARANPGSRSIVISYDTGTIAPGLWERLVDGRSDPARKESIREQLARLVRTPNGQAREDR
ncbi:MAG: hypothetical protein P4L55_10380 [Syntrophobacteraceae bacterium]|nr:hypothetical protein [Syntrophobacteraceae bacterium]